MIGGHSKFLLVTGECCEKRWQLLSCLLRNALWSESVQLGTGVVVSFRIRFGKFPFGGDLCLPLFTSGIFNIFIGIVFPCDFPFKVFDLMETPQTKRAKTTFRDAVIGGHSKFLLVTGGCCKKRWQIPFDSFFFVGVLCVALVLYWQKELTNDKCCPAMNKFEKRTLFSWVLGSGVLLVLQNSLRFFFVGIFCLPLVVAGFVFHDGFPVKPSERMFSHLDLQHQSWKPLLQKIVFWDCFSAWSGILAVR